MDTIKASTAALEHIRDLKPLLAAEGPCLSVYMPFTAAAPGQAANINHLHWRELLKQIDQQVAQSGEKAQALAATVGNLGDLQAEVPGSGKTIAVLRSPEQFKILYLQETVGPKIVLGRSFYIRPLLRELTCGKSFHLLALSQNNVRLIHCTLTSSEEVPLSGAATSFDRYMNSAKPDHSRVSGATAGSSAGSAKAVVGTTNTERETKDEYLSHFFKQIDRSVAETLRGRSEPLILAGVDYELSSYREINSYPHLLEPAVQGAPNGLKSGEMHARALQALRTAYDQKVDQVLAEYDHKVGGGASNRLKDVVTAAHDGRVLTLVVSESLTTTGSFDEATHAVSGRSTGDAADGDLINDAAVQTVLHAGNVLVAANPKMPHGSPVAAIYRY